MCQSTIHSPHSVAPIVFFTNNSANRIEDGRYLANVSGDVVYIKCYIRAVPAITYGELVRISPDGTMREVLVTSTNQDMMELEILDVNVTDATLEQNGTTYECTGINEIGNTTYSVDLVVRGR